MPMFIANSSNETLRLLAMQLVTATLALLVGCGGGSTDASPPIQTPNPPPQSATPTITRVSPDIIYGSANRQEVTITGTNFRSTATVSLSWRNTPSYILPTDQIFYQDETTIRLNITTQEDEDTWQVTITNPDGLSATRAFRVEDPRMVSLEVDFPVEGAFRTTGTTNADCNNATGLWTACQHQSGFHRDGGGISGSQDTYAWDMNLPSDLDVGKPVFAVAAGRVVKYAGEVDPGEVSGAILIEHTTNRFTWWSGYLHMSDIELQEGDEVTTETQLGKVSNVCDCGPVPNHLHFGIYYGQNVAGGLKSRDATFRERSASTLVGRIYVADSSAGLWMIDPIALTATKIGIMPEVMTDIALSPSGDLFGTTFNRLYRIDRDTAHITLIGGSYSGVNALAFRSDGALFGAGGSKVYRIDTTDGTLTITAQISRTSEGDLEFSELGFLYLTTVSFLGELTKVDIDTGTATVLGRVGFSDLYSLSKAPGGFFYSFSGSRMIRINIATGQAEFIHDFSSLGITQVFGATTIR